ncbi:MAG: pentapeptide repeat-containing protein [Desulfobulbus sp.]|nr:pentapeptide repeat-containing protein [Desulfobulbus sp.]
MRFRILYLSCATFLALSASHAWSASDKHQLTPVEKNVQRLLKTKSCPGCDLAGADLSQSRLAKANLNGANLSGANLNLADLSGANLQQAILFETNLSGADLSFADLEGAEFRATKLEGAHFERTRIKGRTVNRLIHADNAQAGWFDLGPDEEHVAANPTGEAKNTESIAAAAPESTTDPLAQLPPPAAGPTSAANTAAMAAPEQPIEAAKPELSEARQQMLEKMFDQERCIDCDLSGLDLSGRDMEGFDLERADFTGSNLQDADFSKANLKGTKFQNCLMQKADLGDADLYRADFTGADLTDADLEDAKVEGADFSGATGLKPAETKGIGKY